MGLFVEKDEFNTALVTGNPPPDITMWDIKNQIPDSLFLDIKTQFASSITVIEGAQSINTTGELLALIKANPAVSIVLFCFSVVLQEDDRFELGPHSDKWIDYFEQAIKDINTIMSLRENSGIDPSNPNYHLSFNGNPNDDTWGFDKEEWIPGVGVDTHLVAGTQAEAWSLAYGLDINYVNDNTSCFPAGTLIAMADGSSKPIEAIAVGDEVLAPNGLGDLVPAKVDKLFENTTQEFVRLTFSDGRPDLTATPGHRFLTEAGDYMEIGDMLKLGGGSAQGFQLAA